MKSGMVWGAWILLFTLTGCQDWGSFKQQLSSEWNALQVVLTGGPSPLAAHASPSPSVAMGQPDQADEADTADAERVRVNSELLQEMIRVVLGQAPQDVIWFGEWVNSLNQGASLEGIYRGILYSDQYRTLESSASAATAPALAFFESEWPKGGPAQVGKSVFTLKRELSEYYLKTVDEKIGKPEQLADWYAKTVQRLNTQRVDFGLKLRNGGTEAFHFAWAMRAPPDRLRWELLNRVHRILNHLQSVR